MQLFRKSDEILPLRLVTFNAEFGACRRGPGLGPESVLYELYSRNIEELWQTPIERINVRGLKPWELKGRAIDLLPALTEISEDVCDTFAKIVRKTNRTLVFSGDHSCAIGLISGFREANPHERIGVVWIDAHGDIHSPFTSPSGNCHGMPVAALAGLSHGDHDTDTFFETSSAWNRLTQVGVNRICPKINSRDFFYFGIRDLEAEEWTAIHANQIPFIEGGADLDQRFDDGLERLLGWAEEYDKIYVSFDVDGMDGALVPGTGTPVSGGLSVESTKRLLKALLDLEQTSVLEISEVNPLLDVQNSVANLVSELVEDVWSHLVPSDGTDCILHRDVQQFPFGRAPFR